MHPVEKLAIAVRHSRSLENSLGLWNLVRPWYTRLLAVLERPGLRRMINGSDRVLLIHELYGVPEIHEPEIWAVIMADVRPGDVVADVGASLGLYTLAFANRVGAKGRVYSFEPDPQSFGWLCRNVALNKVGERVRVCACAVGPEDGLLSFEEGRGTESAVVLTPSQSASRVRSVCLDSVFADCRLDLLKIDVEGFEEQVLRGAADLLSDPTRAPRSIFVEVHPFAWDQYGVSDQSLLGFLSETGFKVADVQGHTVQQILEYGAIVARRPGRDHFGG